MGEHNVHESLIGGANIVTVKVHNIVVIVVLIRYKGCFESVQRVHVNLVIP